MDFSPLEMILISFGGGICLAVAALGLYDLLKADAMHIELYEDRSGQWRWRILARNGNILADSAEAYSTRSNLRRALRSLAKADLAKLVSSALDGKP